MTITNRTCSHFCSFATNVSYIRSVSIHITRIVSDILSIQCLKKYNTFYFLHWNRPRIDNGAWMEPCSLYVSWDCWENVILGFLDRQIMILTNVPWESYLRVCIKLKKRPVGNIQYSISVHARPSVCCAFSAVEEKESRITNTEYKSTRWVGNALSWEKEVHIVDWCKCNLVVGYVYH